MYREHFRLEALPFESTPDPAFFYLGPQYRETLAAMIHCVVSRKSLMVVSGPIGSGKTTLGRTLTRYLPENTRLVSILHPFNYQGELINYVGQEAGLTNLPSSRLFLIEAVRQRLVRLLEEGGRLLILIDEAQLLNDSNLEEIRLISNLETETVKLVQVILLGQPELIENLNRPQVRQLRQRLHSIKVLKPMDRVQAIGYIQHRLRVAGGDPAIFSDEAMEKIVAAASGIPRIINQLSDAALLNAFALGEPQVSGGAAEEAIADLKLTPADLAKPQAAAPASVSPPPQAIQPIQPTQPYPAAPAFQPAPSFPSGPPLQPSPRPRPQSAPAQPSLGPEPDFEASPLPGPVREEPRRSSRKAQGGRSWLTALILLLLALVALGASLAVYFDRGEKEPAAKPKAETRAPAAELKNSPGGPVPETKAEDPARSETRRVEPGVETKKSPPAPSSETRRTESGGGNETKRIEGGGGTETKRIEGSAETKKPETPSSKRPGG